MLLLNLLLALAWILLTGEFTPANFFFGLIASYLLIWLVSTAVGDSGEYTKKVVAVPAFILFFLAEIVKANVRVAFDVLTIRHYMKPAIIGIELEAKTELEITMLANLITLTPGTLSLDISDDRKVLYVHAMYVDDPESFRKMIKEQLEKRLLEVIR